MVMVSATKVLNCANYITFEDILRSIIAIVSPDGSGALRILSSVPASVTSPVTCTNIQDFLSLLQDCIVIDSDGCPSLNVCGTIGTTCGGNCVTGSTLPEILSSIFVTDGTNTYVRLTVTSMFEFTPQN